MDVNPLLRALGGRGPGLPGLLWKALLALLALPRLLLPCLLDPPCLEPPPKQPGPPGDAPPVERPWLSTVSSRRTAHHRHAKPHRGRGPRELAPYLLAQLRVFDFVFLEVILVLLALLWLT